MENIKYPTPSDSYLFKRLKIRVKNRSVLAAMTNKQSLENGIISNEEIEWLKRRAEGGFGIITSAATNVSLKGKAWEGEFGVYDDLHIPSLKKLTSVIHLHESLIFAQLFHGGIRCPQKLNGVPPLSPSKLSCNESKTGYSREASEKEISEIIKDFTSAALRCSEAGFDGIELHGAHGYLISQFLGIKTNLRQDSWGGDLEGRSRFLVEIINSIKNNVPESFIVGARISPEIDSIGINLNDSINLVGTLKNLNLDFIHLSCWDSFCPSTSFPNDKRTLTEILTESYIDLPTIISTGGVWSSEDAQKLLNQGADLIGVARVAIAHPDWPNKISNKNYSPKKPPFTTKYLKEVKLSSNFVNYMKNWPGFVVGGKRIVE